MKKIIVILFLVLTVFVAIGLGVYMGVYKRGVIKKGNLLIYNKTPFSNKTVLNSFNYFWSKHSKLQKQKAESLYYWVVKAGYKVVTDPFNNDLKDCFSSVETLRFFKPGIKYIINRKPNGYYYVNINNYKINLLTKQYSMAKEFLNDERPYIWSDTFYFVTNNNGNKLKSCNHKFLKTKKTEDALLKPSLMQSSY